MGRKERMITGEGDMGYVQVKIAEHVLATLMTHHRESSLEQQMELTRKEAYNLLKEKHLELSEDIKDEDLRQRLESSYKNLDDWNKENFQQNCQSSTQQNPVTSCSCENKDEDHKAQQVSAEVSSQQGSTRDAKLDDSAFELLEPNNNNNNPVFVDEQSSTNKTEEDQNDAQSLASHDSPAMLQESQKEQDDDGNKTQKGKVSSSKKCGECFQQGVCDQVEKDDGRANSYNQTEKDDGRTGVCNQTEKDDGRTKSCDQTEKDNGKPKSPKNNGFESRDKSSNQEFQNKTEKNGKSKTNSSQKNPRSKRLRQEFSKLFASHDLSYESSLDCNDGDLDDKLEATLFIKEAEKQLMKLNLGLSYQLCRKAYFRHPTKRAFEYLQVVQSCFVSSMLQNHEAASAPINIQILQQIDSDDKMLKKRAHPFDFSWVPQYENLIGNKFKYNHHKSWEAVTPQLPNFNDVTKGCMETLVSGGIEKVPSIVLRTIILYMFVLVVFLWQCFLELSKRILPGLTKISFLPPEVTVQIYDCVNDVGLSSFALRNFSHVLLLSIVSYACFLVWNLVGSVLGSFFWILLVGPLEILCMGLEAVVNVGSSLVFSPVWYINVPLSAFLLLVIGKRAGYFWSLPLMFLWGQRGYWIFVNCSLYFGSCVVFQSSIVSSVLVLSLRALWALFSWWSVLIVVAMLFLLHLYLSGNAEADERQKRDSNGMFNFAFKLANKPPKGATGEIKRVLSCSDYYSVLEVSRDSDEMCIKEARKAKALLTHPDKNGNSSGANEAFQRVKEAYEVLGDRSKRKQYDDELLAQEYEEQLRQQRGSSHHNGSYDDNSCEDFVIRDSYGFDHVAERVNVDAKHARYCEQCTLNHPAKNGDGWIHQRPGFFRGERRVLVCYQGQIFDVTSWAQAEMIVVDGHGRQVPANTHKPSLKLQSNKMRGKRKAARRQQAHTSEPSTSARSAKHTSKKGQKKGKRK
eukprot:TRINITY_DN20130_c0_g1_i3.p1 TRINITY_DN20130_c0_g1~~TRINITY_DN20130_c0_g1_i3.p1  ORF type:complete len:967 (+),score=200.23 TRINITY_DN20130_c0_g1_i3:255-3155(+)